MIRGRLIVAARDAGGAAAVAPIARAAVDEGDLAVEVVARGKGIPPFEHAGLPVYALDAGGLASERLDALVGRPDVCAVVTGTSLRHDYEGALWSAARRAGVPSIAVLDHWCNYAERFTAATPFDTLPDVIAVMDDVARETLVGLGAPPERVRVTGQPYFDALTARAQGLHPAAARAELGANPERPVVVFASEPQRHYFGDALGYDESVSLRAVARALGELRPDAQLYVKLHPLEPDDAHAALAHELALDVRVVRAYSATRLILAADVVCGMTSVFLLEAGVLGRPAISVRPGGDADDHFLARHQELITSVLNVDDLPETLARALDGRWDAVAGAPFGAGAVRNVLALVHELARERQGVRV